MPIQPQTAGSLPHVPLVLLLLTVSDFDGPRDGENVQKEWGFKRSWG